MEKHFVITFVLVVVLAVCSQAAFPTPTGTQGVSATIAVSGTYDGALKRYYGTGDLGTSGQSEDQDPIFELANGATLKNVIIGSPAADGVHCTGACTLQNVWWEDVGEDAATFRGSSSSIQSKVSGGGARSADDKVFQHNGAGTLTIENFEVSNFGKLYRSCGNCGTQYTRHVIVRNVVATAPGKVLVGINSNYGDTADISDITIVGDSSKKIVICERFIGNDEGDEPPEDGSGPDGTNCRYSTSEITYTNTPPASSAGGSTATSSTTKSATSTTKSATSTTSTTKAATTTSTTKAPTTSTTKSATSTTKSATSTTTGSSTTSSTVRSYRLVNVNSGKCLDISGASTSDGADAIQYSCSNSRDSQVWQFIPVDGTYFYLVNLHSGKYLDSEDCGTADDTNVRQWAGLFNNCQQWQQDNAASGIWRFYNRNSGKVLEATDCEESNNDPISTSTNESTDCQKWTLTLVA